MTDDAEKASRWIAEGAVLKRSKKGRLWILDFRALGVRFDDERAGELADCLELRELHLDGTAITSVGLARLTDMPRLETLSLQRTSVDDAGLDELRRFPALKLLLLTGSAVTREAVAALRPRRIGTRIVFEDA